MASRRRYSRKRSRRGKYARRRRRSTLKRTVKRILDRKIETKVADFGGENIQLYHNAGETGGAVGPFLAPQGNVNFFNPWRLILAGTADFNRIGNEIEPRGMRLRIWLANKLDRPNIIYRVSVGILPKLNQAGVVTTATNAEWLMPTVGNGNNLIRRVNHDLGVKMLFDRLIRNEQGSNLVANELLQSDQNNKECHKVVDIWIRRKRSSKIIYNGAGAGATIVNKPVFLCVTPYDSFGTLVTDNIASYAYNCTLYFKDA